MKQRLNDNDFDRQLNNKLSEAESMPPTFGQLFPAQPKGFRFFRIGNIIAFSFLIMSIAVSVSNQNELSAETITSHSANLIEKSTTNQLSKDRNKIFAIEEKAESLKPVSDIRTINKVAEKPNRLIVRNVNNLIEESIFNNSEIITIVKSEPSKKDASSSNKTEVESKMLELSRIPANQILIASDFEMLVIPKIEHRFSEFKQVQKAKQNQKGNLFVGFTSSVDNTWILNQNTYDEFDGYEFAYKIDWGYQYGFRAGYNPVRGIGFEVGYIPKSTKGQRYEDVINLENKKREVDLEYSKIPFKLKWRHPLSKNNNISLNWELGGAYTILHTAYQNNNGKTAEITNRFRSNVWQANTGIMADFDITNRTFISVGLQGSISQDINANKWQTNDDYGKSHSLTLGLKFGISRKL